MSIKSRGEAIPAATWKRALACGDMIDRLPCVQCGAQRLSQCAGPITAAEVEATRDYINCYGWDAAHRLASPPPQEGPRGMTNDTPPQAEFVKAIRRHEVQAMGAAISLRSWHDMERAYNQLRDKIDRWQTEQQLAAAPPQAIETRKATTQYNPVSAPYIVVSEHQWHPALNGGEKRLNPVTGQWEHRGTPQAIERSAGEELAQEMAESVGLLWDKLSDKPNIVTGHSMPEGCKRYWYDLAALATRSPTGERDREQIASLREALANARAQLAYLDERFPTGTTPAAIAQIDAILAVIATKGDRE